MGIGAIASSIATSWFGASAATAAAIGTGATIAGTGAAAYGTKKMMDKGGSEQTRSTVMGPQTTLDEEREDEVTIGSDRANSRKRTGDSRKQLMSPSQSGGGGRSGGLQV